MKESEEDTSRSSAAIIHSGLVHYASSEDEVRKDQRENGWAWLSTRRTWRVIPVKKITVRFPIRFEIPLYSIRAVSLLKFKKFTDVKSRTSE